MVRVSAQGLSDWTEPGLFEVVPGVYRIPLPLPNDGLRAVNVYAIIDGDELVLVDSGWAIEDARKALEKALAALGCGLGDVSQFLVTHIHRDHYTQAVSLRKTFGTPISLGHGERPSLEVMSTLDRRRMAPQVALLHKHGASEIAERLVPIGAGQLGSDSVWEGPNNWVEDGEVISLPSRSLKVIDTPGHTRGHVVYVDEDNHLLFAGDHVLPHITPSIGFEPAPTDQPLGNYLASLRLVRSLPDMRLLPAHGHVGPSVHERTDEILAHHDTRLSHSLNATANGASTAFAVARMMTWTSRDTALDELDPFNQMLAILEIGTHLDALVVMGKLEAKNLDGVQHYLPVAPD